VPKLHLTFSIEGEFLAFNGKGQADENSSAVGADAILTQTDDFS